MGMSPDAVVFYGYDLGTMTDPDDYCESLAPSWLEYDDEEWETALARALGWTYVPFPAGHPGHGDDEAYRAFRESEPYRAWSGAQDEKARMARESGVEVQHYGSSEGDRTVLVAVTDSVQRIDDWGCNRIDVGEMYRATMTASVIHGWHAQLDRFVELLDLARAVGEQEPGWHVAVSYG